MAVINQNWYNLNESRYYPLADTATSLDDEDNSLPSNIVVDIRVRWPDWAGKYAFIGAVAVTSGAVTVTVLVSADLTNDASSYIPIAVISVPILELQVGRQYPLTSMYPGAFGYIVFGSGITINYSGRFSSPAQTLLTSRSAKPHPGLPVTSLNRLNDQSALTGLINLDAVAPLSITKARRKIDGDSKDVILFSLIPDPETFTDVTAGTNILQSLAGDCGKRPESGTCGSPNPIEFINAVGPDCDGMITLEFTGCAVVGRNISEHIVRYVDLETTSYSDDSIVLECSADIEETCDPPFLPSLLDGRLPREISPTDPESPSAPPVTPVGPDSASAPFQSPVILPYCDTFEDGTAYYFHDVGEVIEGYSAWIYDDDISSPADLCRDASISDSESIDPSDSYSTRTETGVTSRNMSVWYWDAPTSNQTIYRTFSTDLRTRITDLPTNVTAANVGQNGGIITNYRIDPNTGGRTFWLVLLQTSTVESSGTFGIYYFNGVTLVKVDELAEQTDLPLSPDTWYRVSLSITQEQDSPLNQNIMLSANITGPIIPWQMNPPTQLSYTVGPRPVSVDDYINDPIGESGLAGLYSHQSATQFSYWKVADNRT